jgi:hypothetical protein
MLYNIAYQYSGSNPRKTSQSERKLYCVKYTRDLITLSILLDKLRAYPPKGCFCYRIVSLQQEG